MTTPWKLHFLIKPIKHRLASVNWFEEIDLVRDICGGILPRSIAQRPFQPSAFCLRVPALKVTRITGNLTETEY